jgi:hypothetical protein
MIERFVRLFVSRMCLRTSHWWQYQRGLHGLTFLAYDNAGPCYALSILLGTESLQYRLHELASDVNCLTL